MTYSGASSAPGWSRRCEGAAQRSEPARADERAKPRPFINFDLPLARAGCGAEGSSRRASRMLLLLSEGHTPAPAIRGPALLAPPLRAAVSCPCRSRDVGVGEPACEAATPVAVALRRVLPFG
jgi:hypothetical protein